MQWFAIHLSIPRSARNSKIAHAQITSMVKLDFLGFVNYSADFAHRHLFLLVWKRGSQW